MCPQSSGLVRENEANISNGHHIHNYSSFDRSLSYRLYNTPRFGEYVPTFVMEGVESDQIQLNSLDRVDSLSLKAPFKGSIRKIKESFMVPNMAILPFNWDRIYTPPTNGDDVPLDANCVILNFPRYWADFFYALWNSVYTHAPASGDSYGVVGAWLTAFVRSLVSGEYVYSAGSLLNVLGYKSNNQFDYGATRLTYDYFFDLALTSVFSQIALFRVGIYQPDGTTLYRYFRGLHANGQTVANYDDFRSFVELVRENPTVWIDVDSSGAFLPTPDFANLDAFIAYITSTILPIIKTTNFHFHYPPLSTAEYDQDDLTSLNPNTLNLSRLLAYQLVCAHYYTNSSVDFIYTAELYRSYVYALEYASTGSVAQLEANSHFSWNGYNMHYDYLSGRMLTRYTIRNEDDTATFTFSWSVLSAAYSGSALPLNRLAILAAVFGFRKSLRYGDYFVGSRPRPLAPINTDVSVNANMVSVIDITRKIQAQRFANSVMRSRSKIENYVKSLFGKAPAPDYHNPFFLTRQEEIIFGDEVQNTANTQVTDANSRTSNFAGNLSSKTFTFHNDDMHPCIYIQIVSFDVRRAYTRSVDRQFLHVDRFDMFNPDFQYIGDQPVYGIELGMKRANASNFPLIFGYQSRDMEYKQRFDQACSGFYENLPGWALTDNNRDHLDNPQINPDFIRSWNSELDQFYLSLTGYSLGSYFHFILITDNNVNAKRAMAVDPQILG